MTREEEVLREGNRIICEYFGSPDIDKLHSFQFGTRWADEHTKNPWRDTKTDPPKIGQEVLFKNPRVIGSVYNPCLSKKDIEFLKEHTDMLPYWMPIPDIEINK